MWRLGWSTKGTVETKTQTTLVEPHILFFCFVNVKPYFYLGKVMILFLIGVRRYGSYKMRS